MWEHSDKVLLCKSQRGLSSEPCYANTLFLDVQPLKYMLVKPLSLRCFDMAVQGDKDTYVIIKNDILN